MSQIEGELWVMLASRSRLAATLRGTCIGVAATILMLWCLGSAAYGSASLAIEPPEWDFGVQEPGLGPTEPKTFTIMNTGDGEVQIQTSGIGWFTMEPDVFTLAELPTHLLNS